LDPFGSFGAQSNATFAWLCFQERAYREPPGVIMLQRGGRTPAGKGVTMIPLKTISEKLAAWRRYREAVRELSQLSDRELDDIGIRRGDIEFIVRRSVAAQASA
jgi:uncharacterized protein YjiS (DUF1127 family)